MLRPRFSPGFAILWPKEENWLNSVVLRGSLFAVVRRHWRPFSCVAATWKLGAL